MGMETLPLSEYADRKPETGVHKHPAEPPVYLESGMNPVTAQEEERVRIDQKRAQEILRSLLGDVEMKKREEDIRRQQVQGADWNDLKNMLEEWGRIQGSAKVYAPDEVNAQLNQAALGDRSVLDQITNTYGLRDRVKILFEKHHSSGEGRISLGARRFREENEG